MITFVELIRKLTIKFFSLFYFWSCDTSSSSSFNGQNTLIVFFLTIDVPIKSRGFALTSPTKLFTYKSCFFLTWSLISRIKVSNFDLSFLLPVFFALAWVLFLLRIFLLVSEVIQGTEETVRLVLDGMCLSAESWIKEVIKLKFSCTERVSC